MLRPEIRVRLAPCIVALALFFTAQAQSLSHKPAWIRPETEKSPPMWGIQNGIVVGLWPAAIEGAGQNSEGGPRGLLRIGYNQNGATYLINFIAVEPVVNGDMEFSEVSPSSTDGKLGKQFWATESVTNSSFTPDANTRGVISHPDPKHPEVEELSVYVFMEKFLDGANPYLKLTIRSDRPGELGLQIFNKPNSAKMERCALTATMGNYSRLRLLHVKDKVIDSRKLFSGYDDIEFDEKEPYPYTEMLKANNGDLYAFATPSEKFNELASWPYQPKSNWRYRPPFELMQYWRVDSGGYDHSLNVRVNGRAKYWAGGSDDKSKYVEIPGGAAFENFELREKYQPGQKFYFGLSLKGAGDLVKGL